MFTRYYLLETFIFILDISKPSQVDGSILTPCYFGTLWDTKSIISCKHNVCFMPLYIGHLFVTIVSLYKKRSFWLFLPLLPYFFILKVQCNVFSHVRYFFAYISNKIVTHLFNCNKVLTFQKRTSLNSSNDGSTLFATTRNYLDLAESSIINGMCHDLYASFIFKSLATQCSIQTSFGYTVFLKLVDGWFSITKSPQKKIGG